MALTGEDRLKLNVLMAQDVRAVRINENHMQVIGLTPQGEARVDLNPDSRSDRYLRDVREFLSGHVFGSPGGYPLYISRWTRMGQAKGENLQKLLMLGEPEAVVAVVHAQALTADTAESAWWCMPESENARRMLEKPAISKSPLGPVLAGHLYEHLAFETEPRAMIDSVRLMLQPGLIDEERREKLWQASQRKNACLVGFLQAIPDDLPHGQGPREDFDEIRDLLGEELADNPYMKLYLWWLGSAGQSYLETFRTVLAKPANQDVVVHLLNTLHQRLDEFLPVRLERMPRDVMEIEDRCARLLDPGSDVFGQTGTDWQAIGKVLPEISDDLHALLWLAQCDDNIVTAIFAQTTAEGTLMRRKLEPVTTLMFRKIRQLQHGG